MAYYSDHVELMQVQDCFALKRDGLTLVPDFPLPHREWNNLDAQVLVITPDGEQKEFQAKFTLCHFNILFPSVDINCHWRIVVSLPQASKEDMPVGSKIWVTRDIQKALGLADS